MTEETIPDAGTLGTRSEGGQVGHRNETSDKLEVPLSTAMAAA